MTDHGERRGRRRSLPQSERGSGGPSLTRPPSKTAGTWLGVLLPGLELGLAAALLGALGIFHVWSRTQVLEAGYALSSLQAEHSRLVAAKDRLEIELGMLTSPRALEDAARTKLAKLGLALPARGAVWAAGPDRDDPGRAGGKGVDHPSRPAGPILGMVSGGRRSAAGEPLEEP